MLLYCVLWELEREQERPDALNATQSMVSEKIQNNLQKYHVLIKTAENGYFLRYFFYFQGNQT